MYMLNFYFAKHISFSTLICVFSIVYKDLLHLKGYVVIYIFWSSIVNYLNN